MHASADPQEVAVGLVRGAFEYQGQKCSAASRAYVPKSLWPAVKERMVAMMKEIKMGDVRDFRNFMGAVIDEKAFKKISGYLADAKKNATIVAGGGADDRKGYFIEPTLVQAKKPDYRLMCEEIFGPVLTTYVYQDKEWTRHAEDRGLDVAVRADRRRVRRRIVARSSRRRRRYEMPPATSTSTTSRPARWSASSRLAAAGRRARTTKRDRR